MSKKESKAKAIVRAFDGVDYHGLTAEEIASRANSVIGSREVTAGYVKSKSGMLICDDAKLIVYRKGVKGNDGSLYTLNTIQITDHDRKVLSEIAEEIRSYMENTGYGIVDLYKWYSKRSNEFDWEMTKEYAYSWMRELQSGGLRFYDFPKVYHPTTNVVEKDYGWELLRYVKDHGIKEMQKVEVKKFLIDVLGVQPGIDPDRVLKGDPVIESCVTIGKTYQFQVRDDVKFPEVFVK